MNTTSSALKQQTGPSGAESKSEQQQVIPRLQRAGLLHIDQIDDVVAGYGMPHARDILRPDAVGLNAEQAGGNLPAANAHVVGHKPTDSLGGLLRRSQA